MHTLSSRQMTKLKARQSDEKRQQNRASFLNAGTPKFFSRGSGYHPVHSGSR